MFAYTFLCVSAALAGVVNVPIELVNNYSTTGLLKTNLTNRCMATIHIGSDRQEVLAEINTGSSALFVVGDENTHLNNTIFNSRTSSTFYNTTEPFTLQYSNSTIAAGFISKDTLEVGGAAVQNSYFAYATTANNTTTSVLGVGFSETNQTYPSFPLNLKTNGLINKVVYSLYLNNTSGNILFGGVDHAKYTGKLGLVPVVQAYPNFSSFHVILNNINITSQHRSLKITNNTAIPVNLDTSSNFGVLPTNIVKSMGDAYGYAWNATSGHYEGSCNNNSFDYMLLDFSGVQLKVPYSALVVPKNSNNTRCILAVQKSDKYNSLVLGTAFLRHFYTVFDLENNQVALAQANYTKETNIEEIVSTIPSATSAPSYSSTEFVTSFITAAQRCSNDINVSGIYAHTTLSGPYYASVKTTSTGAPVRPLVTLSGPYYASVATTTTPTGTSTFGANLPRYTLSGPYFASVIIKPSNNHGVQGEYTTSSPLTDHHLTLNKAASSMKFTTSFTKTFATNGEPHTTVGTEGVQSINGPPHTNKTVVTINNCSYILTHQGAQNASENAPLPQTPPPIVPNTVETSPLFGAPREDTPTGTSSIISAFGTPSAPIAPSLTVKGASGNATPSHTESTELLLDTASYIPQNVGVPSPLETSPTRPTNNSNPSVHPVAAASNTLPHANSAPSNTIRAWLIGIFALVIII